MLRIVLATVYPFLAAAATIALTSSISTLLLKLLLLFQLFGGFLGLSVLFLSALQTPLLEHCFVDERQQSRAASCPWVYSPKQDWIGTRRR